MKILFITITTILLAFTNLNASQQALDHANPMPNLVRYAISHAQTLKLSKEQEKAIQQWSSTNKPKVQQLVRRLTLEENKLLKEALYEDESVIEKSESSLMIRREIIEIKTHCRTHLKSILTRKQYNQVLDIYKEAQYQKSEIIL